MGLLDRPDSTLLIVIFAVCVLGLVALAAMSLMPRLRNRGAGAMPPEAYPAEQSSPVKLADRLAEPAPTPAVPEPPVASPKPTAAKRTSTTAKKTGPSGRTTKRAPAKRSTQKPRAKD